MDLSKAQSIAHIDETKYLLICYTADLSIDSGFDRGHFCYCLGLLVLLAANVIVAAFRLH
jgi:hypothetical protein